MVRDLLGRRIKRSITDFEYRFMEKYYIFDDKIYQIIRIKKIGLAKRTKKSKLDFLVELEYLDTKYKETNKNRVKKISIPYVELLNKRLFDTHAKAKNFLLSNF